MTNETTTLCIRLSDGTELIADSTHLENDFVLTNVLQLLSVPDEQNQTMRMAVVPFMPYTNGEFVVPGNLAIVSMPSDELEKMHRERFGKIIIAKSSIIS